MSDLPLGRHENYIGIDPGFSGAISRINQSGSLVDVWDLPTISGEKDREREFDLGRLHDRIRSLRRLPDPVVGLEYPTTRPGEGAERAKRFGQGLGFLEAMLYCCGLPYYKIVPNLWKGRLGLPGKETPGANAIGAEAFKRYYPAHEVLIFGPRKGILDGRLDALMIAHFLRTNTLEGRRAVADQFGKGSPEAMALVLGAGGRGSHRKSKAVGI